MEIFLLPFKPADVSQPSKYANGSKEALSRFHPLKLFIISGNGLKIKITLYSPASCAIQGRAEYRNAVIVALAEDNSSSV
jgi:hypothetical protein